jgi:precorrin-6A/cobalt-precorrin-6A reductase
MILVLGGTSTAHNIISQLTSDFLVTVATEYGLSEFRERYGDKVIHIRFTHSSLEEFIVKHNIVEIIDATHPHAVQISEIALLTAEKTGIRYVNRVREIAEETSYDKCMTFSDYSSIVGYLSKSAHKSILITTGSNSISSFSGFANVAHVRVLPFEKSIKACIDAGFHYSKIIAMQGPFSKEFNIALLKEINADCLVTKNSGDGSGYDEKVQACKELGIEILVINPSPQG